MATPEQEEQIRGLAIIIDKALMEIYGKSMGFFLTAFDFDEPGMSDFISNAQREGIIKSMEEAAKRFRKDEIIPAIKGQA